MPPVLRHALALSTAMLLSSGALVSTSHVATATAAAAPWTLPSRPAACTTAQADSGDVATCTMQLGPGLPETRGWPAAPFPVPSNDQALVWVDLAVSAPDHVTVAKVQKALVPGGYLVAADVDGYFGPVTQAAVKKFQTDHSLPVTGIVNAATAKVLGVQRTGGGTFPPTGWVWQGWGYNGSSALSAWEKLLAPNTTKVGTLQPGSVRSFAGALPLFDGFLAEIQAKGYAMSDGGNYVFRCTAGTRKDCSGLSRASLSNHAYGLAVDINSGSNPMTNYSMQNGVTACSTPVRTDIPRWVVQVAEKWGLYWGGYGWNSGCDSPTQFRSSLSRDPMHFEFNGTVAQARAILRQNVGKGACYDVSSNAGVISNYCLMRTELPAARTRTVIQTKGPAGATAALVNLTITNAPTTGGYLTAESCAAVPAGLHRTSNANAQAGRVVAATAIVSLDAKGRFCLYQSAPFHKVVDVQGYFVPSAAAPNGNLFTPVDPTRVLDTRVDAVCGPTSTCITHGPVPSGSEVVVSAAAPVEAVATMANITVAAPTGTGYVTVDSCANLVPGHQTRSNINVRSGDTLVSNLAVSPSVSTALGAQFCTYGSVTLDEMIDVQGFFAPVAQGGLGYTVLAPSRLVDTRQCWTEPVTHVQRCALVNAANSVVRLMAPAGAAAVVVNVTAVNAATAGAVTVGSCSWINGGERDTTTVQMVPGAPTSNLTVAKVDPDGTFCARVSTAAHLIVDLVGTFSAGGDLRFVPISPVRLHDSRPPL
ncbi:MAG: peptidoglycan-binding protein [Actinomycetota bacterium]